MYCVIDDIFGVIQLPQLLQLVNDENRSAADIDLTDSEDVCVQRLNTVISDASAEIDGYLRGRYTLPMTGTPEIVKSLCVDLSLYRLYKRRWAGKPEMENVEVLNKLATTKLENIRKGTIVLDVDAISGQSVGVRVNKTSDDRVFVNLRDLM